METKIKCPDCGRCIGFINSTDKLNSILKVVLKIPINIEKNEHIFHTTCPRCKNEVYLIIGFKN